MTDELALTDDQYLAAVRELLVGRGRFELPSPTLILDLRALHRNIDTMARWSRDHAAIRPHAKVHKSAEIAHLQMQAGAVGITTATVAEALYLASRGIPNLLVANQIGDTRRALALASIAGRVDITVGVDSIAGAAILSEAGSNVGTTFDVLIEVDLGMGRGGVRSPAEALALAEQLATMPVLAFRGVMGWEGHTATELDKMRRRDAAAHAADTLLLVVDTLSGRGFQSEVISAGGTNTYDLTGSNPRVTDIQAGTYAVMDTSYQRLSPAFEPVLSVVGTVLSSHGERVILDCGSKVQATTHLSPPILRSGQGTVVDLHEEHALIDVQQGSVPRIGDRLEILVSYASGTVNLHDFYAVCDGEEVIEIWPICATGRGAQWQTAVRS